MGIQKVLSKSRVRIKIFTINVMMPLFIGGLIYIVFRSDLLMFRWFDHLGLSELVDDIKIFTSPIAQYLPDWIIYSLPDSLWIYSFTSVNQILWKDNKQVMNFIFFTSIMLGCGAELMQEWGLLSGTFDWMDFILCLLAVIFSIIKHNKYNEQENINQDTDKLGTFGHIPFACIWK